MNPFQHTYVALDTVKSADLNGIQNLCLDAGQLVNGLTGALNGAWLGPRPTMATADLSNTSIIIGATPAIVLSDFVIAPNTSPTTISGLTSLTHGAWYYVYASVPSTTIGVSSNALSLPQATIHIASDSGFPSSGNAWVLTNAGQQLVAYTGVTSTTLTGCTGGSGTMVTGGAVAGALLQFTTNNTAPDATLTWEAGGTSLRYIGPFRADHGGLVMQFRMTNGRYLYRGGGESSNNTNQILSGSTAGNSGGGINNSAVNVPTIPNASSTGDSTPLIPPTSRHGIFSGYAQNPTSSSVNIYIMTATTDAAGSSLYSILMHATNTAVHNVVFDMETASDQSIAVNSSDSSTSATLYLQVLGFEEQQAA